MTVRKEVVQAEKIDVLWDSRSGENGLDLAREKEPFAVLVVVERLNSKRISRQEQCSCFLVPDRKGKHPFQPQEASLAQLLEERHYPLGIGVRAERVAGRR